MSDDSRDLNTPFLRILHHTLTLWQEDTALFSEELIQKLLAEGENLYQVLHMGLQYAATWDVAAQVVCQTRLFASRLSQYGAWLGLLARALVWCQEVPRLRAELLLVQGQLQRDANDLPAAFATFAEAEPLISELHDGELVVRLLYNQAETYYENGKVQMAKERCLQGLGLLDETSSVRRWQAALLHILGNAQRELGDCEEAQTSLQQALALSKEEDTLSYIRALHSLGLSYARCQKADEAQVTYEACLALLEKTPYYNDKLLVCNNAGSLCMRREQWGKAEQFFREAVEMGCAVPVSRKGQAMSANNMGYLLFQQNRLEEARYFLEHALGLYRFLGNEVKLANALGNLGHVQVALREFEAAKGSYDEALRLLKPWQHMPQVQAFWREFELPRRALG